MPFEALPVHLINSIMGDQLMPTLFGLNDPSEAENRARVEQGLNLFLAGVLRKD